MRRTNSKNITSIFTNGAVFALLLFSSAAAQDEAAEMREQQAAQLRVAVEEQIARLDAEYATRATQLRRQFNDRSRELEENAESEIELSNSMAAIGRVYQDSLAALQREINGQRNSVYAAQTEANDELIAGGEISPGTWAQISSTPLENFPFDPAWVVSSTADEAVATEEPVADAPDESTAPEVPVAIFSSAEDPFAHGETYCVAGRGGIRWYPDRDRDLFGDSNGEITVACHYERPDGWVDNNYDCDDSDSTINPITGHCDLQQ